MFMAQHLSLWGFLAFTAIGTYVRTSLIPPSAPKKISRHPPAWPPAKGSRTGGGDHNASAHRQPHPLDDLAFLRITDTCGVQPIGQLIGGACGVMAHEGCSEVLRNPCAFTLGDEPLASAVEDGAMQLWVEAAQVGIPLHHLIDSEIRKQPTSPRQSSIQQLLKDTM